MRAAREQSLRGRVREICEAVAADLRFHAAAFVERRVVPAGDDRDGSVETLLNWAFLLPENRATAFWDVAQRANVERAGWGLTFRPSGPWPPYSFVPSFGMERRP